MPGTVDLWWWEGLSWGVCAVARNHRLHLARWSPTLEWTVEAVYALWSMCKVLIYCVGFCVQLCSDTAFLVRVLTTIVYLSGGSHSIVESLGRFLPLRGYSTTALETIEFVVYGPSYLNTWSCLSYFLPSIILSCPSSSHVHHPLMSIIVVSTPVLQ